MTIIDDILKNISKPKSVVSQTDELATGLKALDGLFGDAGIASKLREGLSRAVDVSAPVDAVEKWRLAALEEAKKLPAGKRQDAIDFFEGNALKSGLAVLDKTKQFNQALEEAMMKGEKIDLAAIKADPNFLLKGLDDKLIEPTMKRAERRIAAFEKHAENLSKSDGISIEDARKQIGTNLASSRTSQTVDVAVSPSLGTNGRIEPTFSPTSTTRIADSAAEREAAAKAASQTARAADDSPFKDAKFNSPTQRAATTSTMQFKKGESIKSDVDKAYKPPEKVFLYDDSPQSAIKKFFWPNNHAPLRILTKHWHRSSNFLYKKFKDTAYALRGNEPPPAEMAKYIPRMFIPERFLRPTIREMDKAINAAGLVPETVKLEKALMEASDALTGPGSLDARREAAKKIITQSFGDYATRNQEGLTMMRQAAETRLKELEAFRNAKDKNGNDIRLEIGESANSPKRLKKLPGEEMISERQYQATKKYLEDMRDMADMLAKGNDPGNDLMNQFLKKVADSQNGNELANGIRNKIGRLGSDVRVRLADHYKGESGPLKDRGGNVVDKALSHSDVPGRLIYKLESELESGLYIRSINWESGAPANNLENVFSQYVHYNDSSAVSKGADGSPTFTVPNETAYKTFVDGFFSNGLPAHAIHGIYMIHMTQGINRSAPMIPGALRAYMSDIAKAQPDTARGEWAKAMETRIDEVLEQAYRFGERDITKNHYQLQLWEYFKRCGYVSAGPDQKWGIWGIPMDSISPYPGAPAKIVIGNKKAEITGHIKAFLLGQEVWTKKDPAGDKLDVIKSYSNPLFKMRPVSTTPEGKEFLKKKGVAEGAHVEDKWNDRAPRAFKIVDNWTGGSAKDLLATGGLWSRETGFNKNLFWKYYANVGVYGGGIAGAFAGGQYLFGNEDGAKNTLATYGNVLTAPIRYGLQGSSYLAGGSLWAIGHVPDYLMKGVHLGAQKLNPELFGNGPLTDGFVRNIGSGIWNMSGSASNFISDNVRFGSASSSTQPAKTEGGKPSGSNASSAPAASDVEKEAAKSLDFTDLKKLKDLSAIKQESAGKPGEKGAVSWLDSAPVPGNIQKAETKAAAFETELENLRKRGQMIEDAIKMAKGTDADKIQRLELLQKQHQDLMAQFTKNAATPDGSELQERVANNLKNVRALGQKIAAATDLETARTDLGQQRQELLKIETARLQVLGTIAAIDAGLQSGTALNEDAKAKAERESRVKAAQDAERKAVETIENLTVAKTIANQLVTTGQEAYDKGTKLVVSLGQLAAQIEDRAKKADGEEKTRLETLHKQITTYLETVNAKPDGIEQLQEKLQKYNEQLKTLFTEVSAITDEQKTSTARSIIREQEKIVRQMQADTQRLEDQQAAFAKSFESGKPYVEPAVRPATTAPAANGGNGAAASGHKPNAAPKTQEEIDLAAVRKDAGAFADFVGKAVDELKRINKAAEEEANVLRKFYANAQLRGALSEPLQKLKDEADRLEKITADRLRIAEEQQKAIQDLGKQLVLIPTTGTTAEQRAQALEIQQQMLAASNIVASRDGSGALRDAEKAKKDLTTLIDGYPQIRETARDLTINGATTNIAKYGSGSDSKQTLLHRGLVSDGGGPTVLEKAGGALSNTFTAFTNWWEKVGDHAAKKGPNHKLAFQAATAIGLGWVGITMFNVVTNIFGIDTQKHGWLKWVGLLAIAGVVMHKDGKIAERFDALDERNRARNQTMAHGAPTTVSNNGNTGYMPPDPAAARAVIPGNQTQPAAAPAAAPAPKVDLPPEGAKTAAAKTPAVIVADANNIPTIERRPDDIIVASGYGTQGSGKHFVAPAAAGQTEIGGHDVSAADVTVAHLTAKGQLVAASGSGFRPTA